MLAGATGLDRVRGSARRLPFDGATFDAVIAVEVFEHLAAIDEVLREVRRVLRPGGIVAIVDKNAGSWNARRPWLPNLAVGLRYSFRLQITEDQPGGPVVEQDLIAMRNAVMFNVAFEYPERKQAP